VNKKVILRYTLYGAIFGCVFPIISSLLWIYQLHLPLQWASVLEIQKNNPVQWIIDSAPLFLGLFAWFAGIRQGRVERLNTALEARLQERDQLVSELESVRDILEKHIQKQLNQLQTAAQVANRAAAIHDFDELLVQAARLISERFGFYHAGIFLIDETGEYAVLRAASSEGGHRMLERGHRMKVGQQGIVGFVARLGEARISSNVGNDASYLNNPDLPETRSEATLPLKLRDRMIGVLDVQSNQEHAFTEDDLEALQMLADQLALAIDNARLLQESRAAVAQMEKLYRQQVTESWQNILTQRLYAYTYDQDGVRRLATLPIMPLEEDTNRVAVPIALRGQKIGALVLRREADQPAWSPEDTELIQNSIGQVALALENARLLNETRRQASREQLINQLSANFARAADIESLLRTAAYELGQLPQVAEVNIHMTLPEEKPEPDAFPPASSAKGNNGSTNGRSALTPRKPNPTRGRDD
jgi:GAF domain-containing protein